MELLEAVYLGVLQGITEFLPVSSSGHLFLMQEIFGLEQSLVLEIWLHGASLLAVIFFFRKDIKKILGNMIAAPSSEFGILGYKLLLATFCTIPVALFIEPNFDVYLTSETVGFMLIFTGILIVVAEDFRPGKIQEFSWWMAGLLGFFQGLAVIPGISRAGMTIALLVFLGLRRKWAAEISFLLAIPTILGALIFACHKLEGLNVLGDMNYISGFIVAFLTSLLSIKWMLDLIKGKWIWFSVYCLLLGGGVLLLVN